MSEFIGAFRGTTLIHREGELGGARSVFVKLKGIKNELVYPTFGGAIKNPPKGEGFKFYAGDLFEFRTNANGVLPELYLLKTYLVEAASGTTLHIVRDGFKHKPFVGDKIGIAPEEIGGAMTAVATINAVSEGVQGGVNVWTLTLSAALADVKKGDVLVEADAENNMLVKAIQGVADSDGDLRYAGATGDEEFDKARYHYVPALGGIMYTSKMSPMPACVLALNQSKINGWFQIQSV
jgi:hypothetical protein